MSKPKTRSATVPPKAGSVRLDLFLVSAFQDLSRKQAKKAIDSGRVSIGGRIEVFANRLVREGEKVEVAPESNLPETEEVLGPLGVLYRDGTLVAVDKPPGLVSGPTKDKDRNHAEKAARAMLGINLTLLHRLDRDTSGVLLLGVDETGVKGMLEAFRTREVKKVYLAMVSGNPPAQFQDVCHLKEVGNSRVAVVQSGGMRAETSFNTLRRSGGYALVEAHPKTGRMHQLRAQLSRLGFPILGDGLYGGTANVTMGPKLLPVPRQMLHARSIGFKHPKTSAFTTIASPIPKDFAKIVRFLFGEEFLVDLES